MVKSEVGEFLLSRKDKLGGLMVIATALVIGVGTQALLLWRWQAVMDEKVATMQISHQEFRTQLNEIRLELINRGRATSFSRPAPTE